MSDFPPDWKPQHGVYLTVGRNPGATCKANRFLAVVSDGSPQLGHDPVTVLTLETVKNQREAQEWFNRVSIERPWITRS